jgi:DNA repair exonuclease SbcCD nuclease subunit
MIQELIGIGDLHLTDSAGRGGLASYIEKPDEMVADLIVSQPLKYARNKGIKHVLLYGDICESPRMSYDAQLAFSKIVDQPFEFHVIPGNHDKFAEDPDAGHSLEVLRMWNRPNVHVYDEQTDVQVAGLPLRFLPWPGQRFHSKRLNVAHVDVHGSKTDSGRLNDKDGLSDSNGTAVVGHIHTNQRVRNTYYSGTVYQTNFGEQADKFFHHISFDDGWVVENVPVRPTYRLHTITVESRADLKNVPASKFDLIKLVLVSTKIKAADYQHLNVVKTVPIKNSSELAVTQFEEIKSGSQIEISSDEFFNAWLDTQSRPDELKKKALALRRRLLQEVAK